MQIHSMIVLGSFSMMGLSLFLLVFSMRSKSRSFLGKPTIDHFYFYTGKISLFTSWILLLLKAIFPKIGYIKVPELLSWTAAFIVLAGSLLMILSFFALGISLKVGVPDEETILKTKGIYSISRNPLYLGVFMISIASCLYFPDLINIACAIYGMIIHHRITLGEEIFLENRFGENWIDYKSKVRRYL